MQSPARTILLMHSAPELLSALRKAAGTGWRVWPAADWDALERGLRRVPPGAIAVVDPYAGHGGPGPSPRLRELLTGFPSVTVVAALAVTGEAVPDLEPMVRWGVAELIDLGREDTPVALRQRLEAVQGRLVQRLLDRALPRATPTRTRSMLLAAAETVAGGGGAAELAARLGTTERSVLRWCRRADLPDPRRLLAWLRVLMAAEMMDDTARTLSSVARACGYSGDAALRNAVRSFLGAPPRELRGRAFEHASSAFAAELFGLREAAHARGRPERTWLH